jgi:GT2 family glycosyltransferase
LRCGETAAPVVEPTALPRLSQWNGSEPDASTDYVVWLDAPATLLPGALETLAANIARFEPDLVYSDSLLGDDCIRVHRPAFSPVRLRSQDYMGALLVIRADRLRAALVPGVPKSASELARRLVGANISVLHVPAPLFKEPASTTDPRRAHNNVTGEPLVSIVIPTRGTRAKINGLDRTLVVEALRSIVERSTYPNVEFVIVADDETPQAVIDELRTLGADRLRLVRWSAPFNFSAKVNRGAAYARGEYLLLLNDDTELITPDWLEVMLGLAQQPDVGLVGTMLLFEDGTIQHGGHLYKDSSAGHIAIGWPEGKEDTLLSLSVEREVSGVTAACALVSAETYAAVGGLSGLLPGNYNDVDFSLKVRGVGLSVVWTPHARAYHYESKTRVATVGKSELETLRRRWATRILVDPYWS